MASHLRRNIILLCLISASVVELVACGGGRSADQQAVCRSEKSHAASAAIVARFYQRGKLGTEVELGREIEQAASIVRGAGETFFDKSGHLIPYERLTGLQKAAFNHLMFQSAVTTIAHPDRLPATTAVRIERECK